MQHIKWLLLGSREFRSSFTTRAPGSYMDAYDRGREFAHRITFRRFED
jgi:hypothetical protein